MAKRLAESSPGSRSRTIGVAYLLYFVTAILAVVFTRGVVVWSDAAATAANLLMHATAFRLGFALSLIGIALYVTVTALFYILFRPVNRTIALLAAFFSLVGCTIQASGVLFQIAPLNILEGGQSLAAFNVEQLHALVLLLFKMYAQSYSIGLVFFGLFDILIGYLIFKSTFLPRILGVLMALAGLGWLTYLFPALATSLSVYVQVFGILGEAALLLWLLVMGVNEQRWNEVSAGRPA